MSEKKFENCFSKEVLPIAIKLRSIVQSKFPDANEGFYGGAKVKLVLYSQGGPNNVLCGIQEGKDHSCFLYVHHLDNINHERLKFSGKGKHAKRVKFESIDEVSVDDVKWLLDRVEEKAPFL